MKHLIYIFILATLFTAGFVLAQVGYGLTPVTTTGSAGLGGMVTGTSTISVSSAVAVQRGQTGDLVKYLQMILKNDSSLYPSGLVSGYFGPLTEDAVKKLQAKYGLPQTGVVDEKTWNIIFPVNMQLQVVAPNGGETWDKTQARNILWKVTTEPAIYKSLQLGAASTSTEGTVASPIAPFYPYVSIDLVKDSDPSFSYRIATTNLYRTTYAWIIPSTIKADNDYRVRISAGSDVFCRTIGLTGIACPLQPELYRTYSAEDQSDNTFTISDGAISSPTPSPSPSPRAITELKAKLDQMENTLNQLIQQIQTMRSLLNSL